MLFQRLGLILCLLFSTSALAQTAGSASAGASATINVRLFPVTATDQTDESCQYDPDTRSATIETTLKPFQTGFAELSFRWDGNLKYVVSYRVSADDQGTSDEATWLPAEAQKDIPFARLKPGWSTIPLEIRVKGALPTFCEDPRMNITITTSPI